MNILNIPDSRTETDDSTQHVYANARRRMRWGKRLVVGGFFVILVGIVMYCIVSFQAVETNGSTVNASIGWWVVPALGVIAGGTLLWLVGSFVYIAGGLDSDPKGPDLYF